MEERSEELQALSTSIVGQMLELVGEMAIEQV